MVSGPPTMATPSVAMPVSMLTTGSSAMPKPDSAITAAKNFPSRLPTNSEAKNNPPRKPEASDTRHAISFSAITVALLGRNRPLGIVLGAILIGALTNGAYTVEAQTGISTDLTTIIQAVMVLCVAAPALVARIFRLREGSAVSLGFAGWGT